MSLRFHEIAEARHRILNPFTHEQLILLGEICSLRSTTGQLDLCCGKGEMLCVWSQHYGCASGDFATARVDGTFTIAYFVFNTIMNLTTQAAQVACFRNVAAHLEPGGCFVIEVMIPDLRRLPAGQNVVPLHASPTRWVFDVYDIATQTMSSNYVEVTGGRGEYISTPFRYVWLAELDLMAQLAGLQLRERWGGWTREPFTSESRQHVSIWEKPTRKQHLTPSRVGVIRRLTTFPSTFR